MPSPIRMLLLGAIVVATAGAYEPIPRRIPPAGKPIPANSESKLETDLFELRKLAAAHREDRFFPDAEIYLKAVDLALEFGEFYKPKEDVAKAGRALAEADRRLELLQQDKAPWSKKRGLVVRGYHSTIDGSAQPYGLEIPEKHDFDGKPVPLYVWLHGRGDSKTDLHFLDERAKKHWQFKGHLDDGLVLHPFGRQCIGYKSAGEIDVLDAVDHVLANYNVDPDRVALMGFSMGGAGAWHLGAHYPDKWAVVHAGAGFVDVKRYQRLGASDMPPPVEQTLWGLYDVPDYARNLLNVPVVAYSGENDKQKDAADYMNEVFRANGYRLTHHVGPGMGHKYHPDALEDVAAFIRRALANPKDRDPEALRFQTKTLRYHRCAWLEVTRLARHWTDTRVDAGFAAPNQLRLMTRNVAALRINRPLAKGSKIHIDDQTITLDAAAEHTALHQGEKGRWKLGEPPAGLAKSPGLQGPIDDAFLAPFLVVTPSAPSSNPQFDKWTEFEIAHFKTRWRALFRGDLRVIPDNALTPDDAKRYNLILFGTPESNKAIPPVLDATPLEWPEADNHLLLAIYPNPAAPNRYVVLNSGPTFREAHDRTNSLQNPKLGDWAVINLAEPPGPERPGKIVRTGFFDERWQP